MRQVGTKSHGAFKDLTDNQFDKLKDHPLIKELEYRVSVALAENKELDSRQTQLEFETPGYAWWGFTVPDEGKLPIEYNEIATDTIVLDLLNIPHKIGEIVNISYSVDGIKYSDEFILSGFWRGDPVSQASMILVSKPFIDSRLSKINQQQVKENFGHEGLICASFMFSSSFNIEKKINKIIKDAGFEAGEINYGVNWAYIATNIGQNNESILFILGAIILIFWTGYLIINNIFSISVSMDIRFYGLLKTLGTTNSQINKYIQLQATLISFIGIPLGLLLGSFLGFLLSPFLLVATELQTIQYTYNIWVLILSTLFSILTIFISSIKPGRKAAQITPIEGVIFTEKESKNHLYSKLKQKKSKLSMSKLAMINLLRHPRKTVIVILSISLSLFILNCINSEATSFDMNIYIENMAVADYQLADKGTFGYQMYSSPERDVSLELSNEISTQPWFVDGGFVNYIDIKHILPQKQLKRLNKEIPEDKFMKLFPEAIEEHKKVLEIGEVYLQLYGLDSFLLDNIKIVEGNFNKEKFINGAYVILSNYILSDNNSYSHYKPGEFIPISFNNEDPILYEVMVIGEIPYGMSAKYSISTGCNVILPSLEWERRLKSTSKMSFHFNVIQEDEVKIDDFISSKIEREYPSMFINSKKLYLEEYNQLVLMTKIVGGTLVVIVGLIGILNLLNTTLTGLHARRREFALLESIGMTKEQLKRMINWEGLLLGILVIFTTFLLIGITAIPFRNFLKQSWASTGDISLLTTYITAPFVIFITVFIPRLALRYTGKSTIDILRESE